jgi:hypothetical protein
MFYTLVTLLSALVILVLIVVKVPWRVWHKRVKLRIWHWFVLRKIERKMQKNL